MRVLIIEDEARAASQLQKLLEETEFRYELVGIIDSIEESKIWFQKNGTPDLIFMDIQLADGLSFEIFEKVKLTSPVIFTTAFDQYAIQAFKVNSIDYLLKPVQKEDLQHALQKFMDSNRKPTFGVETIQQVLANLQMPQIREGILVRDGGSFVQLRVADLLYLYSEDSVTFGVTPNGRFVIEETLDYVFSTLDPSKFFRINRAQVVTKSAIVRMDKYFNHRLKLTLLRAEDREFVVSRQKTIDFKEWMNR